MTYEDLLNQGMADVDKRQALIEKQLLKMLKEASRQAKVELAWLYQNVPEITLPEGRKYNRLEKTIKAIEAEIKKMQGQTVNAVTGQQLVNFETGWNRAWYAYESAIGSVSFGVLPINAIRDSVFSEQSGATFVKRFGKLYTSTTEYIAEAITRGLASGQSYAKTAQAIQDAFEQTYWKAVRVVRTETTRNYTQGNLAQYDKAQEMGIEGSKVWSASLDGRTRPDHARLNGQKADKDGLFHIGSDSAPGPGLFSDAANSVNCRCAIHFIPKSVEKAVQPPWSYDDWVKLYGSKVSLDKLNI